MNKTVLVTGGTGYIGSWVVKGLLEKGYTVRVTVRDESKKSKYRHLKEIENKSTGTLEIWQANLLEEGTYDMPAKGADYIMHLASPFIMQFKDPQAQLINPAVEGTKNVLQAANNSGTVKRVVLTSSSAAVYGDNADMTERGLNELDESHFNKTSSLEHQPYSFSKVTAEKEAWKMYEAQSDWELVVINPSFVMGPSLGENTDSGSLSFMNDILKGKYFSGAPHLVIGFVDVRDVADAHIKALENESAIGRFIISEQTLDLFSFTRIIKKLYGNKFRLPLMKTPKLMLYPVGWIFGLTIKYISRNVGYPLVLNASKSKEILEMKYLPLEKTVKDMVDQMKGLA